MRRYSCSNFPYSVYRKTLRPEEIWNFIEIPDSLVNSVESVKAHHAAIENSILEHGIINPVTIITTKEYSEKEVERLRVKSKNIDSKMRKHRPFKTSYLKDPLWFEKDKIPPSTIDDEGIVIVCRLLGGTRLKYAQKHNIPVPCLISDLAHKYRGEKGLSHEEVLESFKDTPARLSYTSLGIEMSFK